MTVSQSQIYKLLKTVWQWDIDRNEDMNMMYVSGTGFGLGAIDPDESDEDKQQ